jgi:sugar/nucleoside kinase (ribokinase family)
MSKQNGQIPKKYDVVTIDDALVDEFYACSEDDLAARRIPAEERASEDDARTLLSEKGKTQRSSGSEEVESFAAGLNCVAKAAGGGGTNTLAMMQHYGAKTAFCGKLGVGEHADYFRDSLNQAGIDYYEIPDEKPLTTGTCKVFVTPDCERTMVARLPNQVSISTQDIDAHAEEMLHDAEILFAQGYRWAPASREGFRRAFERMHQLGGKVAFSLSAPFCVEDSRADFLGFIENGTVDILFANEKEIHALYPGKKDHEILETITKATGNLGACKTIAVTFGEEGSYIAHNGKLHHIPAVVLPPEEIVDKTGAGDAYAAGVLYGLARNYPIERCGSLGSYWASEVIRHYGARPVGPAYNVSSVSSPQHNHPYSPTFNPYLYL